MINILLNIFGITLIVKWFKNEVKDYKVLNSKTNYFKFKRFKYLILSAFLIGIPLLVVNFTNIETVNHISDKILQKNKVIYAFITSLFITIVWLIYVYSLDIFDKEKKRHLLLILFLTSLITSYAQIPYQFIHSLGFVNSQNIFDGFIYSVFGIGFIEETVKFIPLLIILWFTKAIDEPYDYILYASVSALGFSFIENAMYLNQHGLEIISARALYATVAHMTFSTVIAYGLFLIKYKKTKVPSILVFLFFYFLAIFSHGFYDFWLINKAVAKFSGLTTLFFLMTIHIWFIMKNNAINASNYFNDTKTINNDKLKVYLIISLLSIFMFSYVYVAFKWNSKSANLFFIKSIYSYGFIICYLIATLSKYNVIKGVFFSFKHNKFKSKK